MNRNVLVIVIVNLLRVLLLKTMVEQILPARKAEERRRQAGIALYYLLTLVLYGIFGMTAFYEAGSGLGLFLFTFLYPGSLIKRFWASLVVFCMDLASGMTVSCGLAQIGEDAVWDSGMVWAVQTLLLLLCTVIMKVRWKAGAEEGSGEEDVVLEKRQVSILFFLPAVSGVVLCVLQNGTTGGTERLLISAAMLFLNLCTFSLYQTMTVENQNIRENEIYRQQTYAYQNQLEVIMESQNRIRALKHDLKNHILALRALLRKQDWEEADRYLNAMQDFMGNPQEYVSTGNDQVDSLLNDKLRKAKNLLNTVEVNVTIPEKLILHSFDLNVVLGNLLDNAMEAAGRTQKKELKLDMKLEKGVLFLTVRNSCQGIADGNVRRLETTKKDGADHGLGLGNVRRIVEKYHGDMEVRSENGYLETDIMMYRKEL